MQCIGVNESCSYEKLLEFQQNNTFSIGPFGTVCGANETFCIYNMSCIPKNSTCAPDEIEYVAARKKAEIDCETGKVFCPYTASCQNEADCTPAPRLNFSEALQNDNQGGWAHLCQMRNLVCPSVSRAVVKCAEARDKYDCNFCPDGHSFCSKNGECLPSGTLCCPKGESRCSFSGSCSAPADCQDESTCEPVSYGQIVTFIFDEDYSDVAGDEEGFKRRLIVEIRRTTGNPCIANVSTAAGSINVSFILTPKKGQSAEDLQQAVALLETQVMSGSFNLTLPSGKVVSADPTSFKAILVTPIVTTAPPTTVGATATPEPDSNKTTIIIVCCVVGGVLLIVIIAITAYCCIKKEKEGKVSPNQSTQRLHEEDVEMSERRKDHPGANNNPAMSP